MRDRPPPPCAGTVVVHRDDAVTCSADTCPKDLGRGVWFSIHATFVRCPEAWGRGQGCPDCGFRAIGGGSPVAGAVSHRR